MIERYIGRFYYHRCEINVHGCFLILVTFTKNKFCYLIFRCAQFDRECLYGLFLYCEWRTLSHFTMVACLKVKTGGFLLGETVVIVSMFVWSVITSHTYYCIMYLVSIFFRPITIMFTCFCIFPFIHNLKNLKKSVMIIVQLKVTKSTLNNIDIIIAQ